MFVTAAERIGAELVEFLVQESGAEVLVEEVLGTADALRRLRDDVFDLVLAAHDPPGLNALELCEAMQAGGADAPVLALMHSHESAAAESLFQAGAAGLVEWDRVPPSRFLWHVARALEVHTLRGAQKRQATLERQRLDKEKREADRLLEQQRELIDDFFAVAGAAPRIALPAELVAIYRDLLRTYVIMGSGNLAHEMRSFAQVLVSFRVSATQAFELHLEALGELVEGLGSRSSRHVMQRADILAIEVLMYLVNGYRQPSEDPGPVKQRLLPGFEADGFA